MKILYAASEAVPFCKTGGLADVAGSLPAALSRQERPGAPVNTQTFSSASFNLETKNIDLNLSGTGYSPGN